MLELSPDQARAADAVREWYANINGQQVFRLFGYAGTGKTTIAKHVAESIAKVVLYAAFTGKAALVMRTRGCADASTIHSLIYHPKEKSRAELERLEVEVKARPDDAALRAALDRERQAIKKPAFEPNEDSDVAFSDLVVVDEVSMVGEKLGSDLLSYGTKVLVLGDPGQLPPIEGGGFFTAAEPDAMLSEVHRQAEGSPVIKLATAARRMRSLPTDALGSSAVLRRSKMDVAAMLAHDQVIVGKHVTRRAFNVEARAHLKLSGALPVPGDRLICLRNNHKLGLLNGQQWVVQAVGAMDDDVVELGLRCEDGEEIEELPVYRHWFEGRDKELPAWNRKTAEEFDFAYAITCHKSQGSQWSSVCVIDEAWGTPAERARWRYTAITRAAERVTVLV